MTTAFRGWALFALLAAALHAAPVGAQSRDEWPLIDAAKRGDVRVVEGLLSAGADVNEVYGDGTTPLHYAAEQGHLEIVRLLVAAGSNVDAGTRIGGYTPLHLASRAGQTGTVAALLAAGADVARRTSQTGVAPLHLAAGSGEAAVIEQLLSHGADVNAVEGKSGQTALMIAAGRNRLAAVEILLARGAAVAATSNVVDVVAEAKDALAAERYFWKLLGQLLETEGGVEKSAWPPAPDIIEAASHAARRLPRGIDDSEVDYAAVDAVINSRGRQINLPQSELVGKVGGMNALLHAVRAGHKETAFALVRHGADINTRAADGSTPLLVAAMNGHFDLMLDLLKEGADPNLASDGGGTPLYAVINLQWAGTTRHAQPRTHEQQKATHLEAMKALLEAGANPNQRLAKDLWYSFAVYVSADLTGTTPFWRAALGLDVDAMRLLVAYGADPTIPSMRPFAKRAAASGTGGRPRSAQIDPSGLPPVPEGGPGIYPIHAASGTSYGENSAGNEHRHVPNGWVPAVKYLVELGADVNARDLDGNSAAHLAAGRGDNELILYLVEQGADVMVVNRRGHTTVDLANGASGRIVPHPETIKLLESMGARNNHNCLSC